MKCNFLLDQALQKLWAATRQDTQHIIQPKRITPFNGAWNSFTVAEGQYILPVPNKRFHVYQVGQLYPTLLGLFPRQDKWVQVSAVCEQQKMLVNIYSNKGIEMPRYSTWYLVTPNRNLLFAVMEQTSIDIDLNSEDLYFRVYSNAYFQGARYRDDQEMIRVIGKTCGSIEEFAELKNQYDTLKNNRTRTPILYINGRKASVLNLDTFKLGDCVEFIVDTSIIRFVEFPLTSLGTFDSIRDLKRKYLLHYNNTSGLLDVDYNDDIDVYITRKDPAKRSPIETGFYYHRNQDDAFRNVTHRDFSITVPYVVEYTKQEIPFYNTDATRNGWVIQLYIRKGGWNRELPVIHNRLHAFYKLKPVDRVKTLLGRDSTFNEWRADYLENSEYMRVLSHDGYDIDATTVENAFGYHAASVLVGDTPSRVNISSNVKGVDLPLILRRYSTGFEYDAKGLLIGYHAHAAGDRYNVHNQKAEIVEMIGGYASTGLDETYNQVHTKRDPDFQYRFYKQLKEGTNPWEDVTGSNDYHYDEARGNWTWLLDLRKYNVIVRSDKNILVQQNDIQVKDGLIKIQMSYTALRGGKEARHPLLIPTGELDVFLNGYSLVEGIDYYVDFPNIYIVNKAFLNEVQTRKQRVVIRAYAFPNQRQERVFDDDYGFVNHGVMSRNAYYNLREDKVTRITVGGRLLMKDEVDFSENDDGRTEYRRLKNGLPYQVKDIIVPMRNLITQDVDAYRERSRDMDRRASLFLTRLIPEPEKTQVSSIERRWAVFSPFCSKIIFDLKAGVLSSQDLQVQHDDNFVLEKCRPYYDLLKYDPTQDDLRVDYNFVEVHPTHLSSVVDLTVAQYVFMEKVIRLFLNNRVDLSSFARIREVV